jgi:acyl carrier protein
VNREKFYLDMTEYLETLDEESGELEIAPDDNLFDEGIVTSYSVVKMIAHLEKLVGRPIDVAQYGVERFYTLSGLYDVVLDAEAQHAGA